MGTRLYGNERRSHIRFATETEISYELLFECQPRVQRMGRVIDLSSAGISFMPPVGVAIALFLAWPCGNQHPRRLTICITGEIVRVQGKCMAAKILRYEYRQQCQ